MFFRSVEVLVLDQWIPITFEDMRTDDIFRFVDSKDIENLVLEDPFKIPEEPGNWGVVVDRTYVGDELT